MFARQSPAIVGLVQIPIGRRRKAEEERIRDGEVRLRGPRRNRRERNLGWGCEAHLDRGLAGGKKHFDLRRARKNRNWKPRGANVVAARGERSGTNRWARRRAPEWVRVCRNRGTAWTDGDSLVPSFDASSLGSRKRECSAPRKVGPRKRKESPRGNRRAEGGSAF